MKSSRLSEEQIIGILKQAEAGVKVRDLCRQHGISDHTYYRWKPKYGGMEVSEARRLKVLEEENHQLKQLLAEKELDILGLRTALQKSTDAATAAGSSSRDTDSRGKPAKSLFPGEDLARYLSLPGQGQ
jgi:putative transposase